MTLDDVRSYGRPAFLSLPIGAFCRHQPDDGRVRILSYPHRPKAWGRASASLGEHPHGDEPRLGRRNASARECHKPKGLEFEQFSLPCQRGLGRQCRRRSSMIGGATT